MISAELPIQMLKISSDGPKNLVEAERSGRNTPIGESESDEEKESLLTENGNHLLLKPALPVHKNRHLRSALLLSIVVLCISAGIFVTRSAKSTIFGGSLESNTRSRYAFATFLSGFNDTETNNLYSAVNDQYFDAARLINYQLLHSPSTKCRPAIDFVVLVSANVSEKGREILRREGARVVAVTESRAPAWFSLAGGRWDGVMDKIELVNLVEYEKLCFLDADTIVHQPIDGVFQDPATNILTSLGVPDKMVMHDYPEPSKYMFAGVKDAILSRQGNKNSSTFEYFNAGFFCWHPSQEIFQYYLEFLSRENSFLPLFPEQNMLNVIHNPLGNMPFKRLNFMWNAQSPSPSEMQHGIRTMHLKAWLPNDNLASSYPELNRIWWYQKREMEAYYRDVGIWPSQDNDTNIMPDLVPEPT